MGGRGVRSGSRPAAETLFLQPLGAFVTCLPGPSPARVRVKVSCSAPQAATRRTPTAGQRVGGSPTAAAPRALTAGGPPGRPGCPRRAAARGSEGLGGGRPLGHRTAVARRWAHQQHNSLALPAGLPLSIAPTKCRKMVARTINDSLMEVEHTPPVHKRVRIDGGRTRALPRRFALVPAIGHPSQLAGAQRTAAHTHTALPACTAAAQMQQPQQSCARRRDPLLVHLHQPARTSALTRPGGNPGPPHPALTPSCSPNQTCRSWMCSPACLAV